jgi:L-threonylcarbamoyladenylate synthase
MLRLNVDPAAPARAVLDRAAETIRAGGVVALPTDTLYALAADPFSELAVGRVLAAKIRTPERGLPLVAADVAQIVAQIGELSPLARMLAARFWPGPLTLLVAAPDAMAPAVAGGTGRVGVRVPAHAVARELCRACGCVLTATSANISGRAATADPDDVMTSLGARVDVLLDGGKTPGGLPSTIVDVSAIEPRLVRDGAISWETVLTCVRHER